MLIQCSVSNAAWGMKLYMPLELTAMNELQRAAQLPSWVKSSVVPLVKLFTAKAASGKQPWQAVLILHPFKALSY